MRLKLSKGILLISASGPLVRETVRQLQAKISDTVLSRVIVDVSDVTEVDATAIAELTTMGMHGGIEIALLKPIKEFERELPHRDKAVYLKRFDTLDEAIASLMKQAV